MCINNSRLYKVLCVVSIVLNMMSRALSVLSLQAPVNGSTLLQALCFEVLRAPGLLFGVQGLGFGV